MIKCAETFLGAVVSLKTMNDLRVVEKVTVFLFLRKLIRHFSCLTLTSSFDDSQSGANEQKLRSGFIETRRCYLSESE